MSIITRCRIHSAVYWVPVGMSQSESMKVTNAPVEIECRWDEETEELLDNKGDAFVSNAAVICDRLIIVGGYLYKGTLASLNGVTDPTQIDLAFKIRKVAVITKLRNPDFTDMDKTLVIAYL